MIILSFQQRRGTVAIQTAYFFISQSSQKLKVFVKFFAKREKKQRKTGHILNIQYSSLGCNGGRW